MPLPAFLITFGVPSRAGKDLFRILRNNHGHSSEAVRSSMEVLGTMNPPRPCERESMMC